MLLLYSGGLDTSVMLKWIQDEYGAEVVAPDRQPRPARRGLRRRRGQGAASSARSTATSSTRARSSRSEYVAAGDQGQRPLRRRLPAVHRARPPADRQARRRVRARDRLRHDRPRLHRQGQRPGAHRGDGRDARARAEGHRAGARLADGPRGGDRLRARARHPGQGRHRGRAVLDRRQPLGPLVGGRAGSRTSTHAPDDDVFQLVTRPEQAPDEPEIVDDRFERGRAGRAQRRAARSSSSCSSAPPRSAARHGVGIVDHIEDRIVGLKVRDIYEVPAAAIMLPAHHELERLVGTIHQNQFKPRLDQQWAYLVYAGLWWEPLRSDLDAYMDAVNEQVTGTIGAEALQGHGPRRHARVAERRLRRGAGVVRASPAGCSPSRPRPASSSCGRCSRGWPTAAIRERAGRVTERRQSSAQAATRCIGWIVWQIGARRVAEAQARPEPLAS